MEDKDNSVLLTTFTSRKKRYKVVFHHGQIIWDNEKPPCVQCNLPMENVIAVNQNYQSVLHQCEEPTLDPLNFTIDYAEKGKQSTWQYKSITFSHTDSLQIASWVKTLQNHLKTFIQRPKRLLIFVNPYGGKRNAMKIYEKYAKPLFELAGVDVTVNVSQRKNQIWEFVSQHNLDMFDAVGVVGGDGTVSELFNGLVMRECRIQAKDYNNLEEPLPKTTIPVGIIPGGSTNTIAYCLHGTTDFTTNVLHILFGDKLGLDLVGVYDESKLLRLYASVLSYGYLGDVAHQSDAYRWMGPKRYDYTGFKKIVQNRGYEGELAILTDEVDASGDSELTTSSECYGECDVCASAALTSSNTSSGGLETVDLPDNIVKQRSLDENNRRHRWKIVNGKFFMVSGANISCACDRTPSGMAPYTHLGDGRLHLVLVRKTSIVNVLRLLLRLTGGRQSIETFPFVEVHKATEFCFRSINVQSKWNCDGEVQTQTDIRAKVWCQLLTVFSRHRVRELDTTKSTCCDLSRHY